MELQKLCGDYIYMQGLMNVLIGVIIGYIIGYNNKNK